MEQNSVSVIIPTYRRAHLINRAIQSVLNQTYRDFKIMVVIDGPDNDTIKVLKSIADDRIRYIIHEKNMGISAARNTGIQSTDSKYVAFLDDDDEWAPQKLYKQVKVADDSSEDTGVIYTDVLICEDNSNTCAYFECIDGKKDTRRQIVRGRCITPSTVLVKRECFRKIGLFDTELERCEDWEFWLRVSEKYKFVKVCEPLTIFHETSGQRLGPSENIEEFLEVKEVIVTKYFKRQKKLLAYNLFGLGVEWYDMKEHRRGRQLMLKSFKLDPFNPKYVVAVATYAWPGIFHILESFYRKHFIH